MCFLFIGCFVPKNRQNPSRILKDLENTVYAYIFVTMLLVYPSVCLFHVPEGLSIVISGTFEGVVLPRTVVSGGYLLFSPTVWAGFRGTHTHTHTNTGTHTGTYIRMLYLAFNDLPLKKCPVILPTPTGVSQALRVWYQVAGIPKSQRRAAYGFGEYGFKHRTQCSFIALTELRGENSLSSSQPIICVRKRTHRVFRRTHRVRCKTQ